MVHILGGPPTYPHAETHEGYMPRQQNVYVQEAARIASDINKMKVTDPRSGTGIYDGLVDQLINNTLAIAKRTEHAPEPLSWTAPQRAVWRYSNLPYEDRAHVVDNISIMPNMKAFVCVNAGRWLTVCPLPNCKGTQYASWGSHRFWCVDCSNKAVGGKWLEVVWPENYLIIEQWLLSRPVHARNWNPGETAEDIARQDLIERASNG